MVQDDLSWALHARALACSRDLSGELWERWHDVLLRELRPRFPALEAEEVSDAITSVILSYTERPAQYQPDRLPLDRYLRMSAHGDLLNLITKKRRQPKLVPLDPVAHDRPARNSRQEAEERDDALAAFLPADMPWEAFMLKLAELFPDPHDREVVELMAEGEREWARFAHALGYDHLDADEQRRRVKQARDRIRLRLKRFGVRLHA